MQMVQDNDTLSISRYTLPPSEKWVGRESISSGVPGRNNRSPKGGFFCPSRPTITCPKGRSEILNPNSSELAGFPPLKTLRSLNRGYNKTSEKTGPENPLNWPVGYPQNNAIPG